MSLEKFVEAKQSEILRLKDLEGKGSLPKEYLGTRPDFVSALKNRVKGCSVAIIAEYKRASPSRGVICEKLSAEDVARAYTKAGASALSILTEEKYFNGNISFLEKASKFAIRNNQNIPLLRKDFIFDPLQIVESASTPASALLLIVRLTPNVNQLRDLREKALEFGIRSVVEIFNSEELIMARKSGAKIIQVNARDLKTFTVNRNACLDLAKKYPPLSDEIWISASGISEFKHLQEAYDAGYNAVLVGTKLMENGDPEREFNALIKH